MWAIGAKERNRTMRSLSYSLRRFNSASSSCNIGLASLRGKEARRREEKTCERIVSLNRES